ncbi:MAG: ankyrin repeat domain-containing protein [Candidatus Dependentiae bacterium]|nr:ankyrin repeat domain-containing protein [Candidatus Dependentiae bacterium]
MFTKKYYYFLCSFICIFISFKTDTLLSACERLDTPKQRKINIRLIRAIKNIDLIKIRLLLENKADVNSRHGEKKITPLHQAVNKGSLDVIRLLIESNAQINAGTKYGTSPIHWATMCNNRHTTQCLLDYGALTHLTDKMKETPFHWAADNANNEALTVLLAHELHNHKLPINEIERVSRIAHTLSMIPSDILPLILDYKGVETTTDDGIVTDFVITLPSLIMKNKSNKRALDYAQTNKKITTNRQEIEAFELCITLLESHQANTQKHVFNSIKKAALYNYAH